MLQRAVADQQFGRRLLADAAYPGNVVRRIAHQGLEVDKLLRADAVALADGVCVIDLGFRLAAPRDWLQDHNPV